MQSFTSRKKVQETETLIKESLLRQLSYSVKEIQLSNSSKNEVLCTNDGCNSLIVVLEAIFLHGLKKGIFKTALRTVSGMEGTKPQPSFWNMVCNYTHKDTISTIKNLSQITTDVGKCRVWLRLALNEAEFISYITAMEKDRRALNSFYSNFAFLRDRETCDTACKFLEGILDIQFNIPINSSILNTWSSEPLLMSGIWFPPMKTPLSSAVDVAERIEDDDCDDDLCSIKTSSSVTTLSTILALDETQALKMILETPFKKLNQDVTLTSSQEDICRYDYKNVIIEEEKETVEVGDTKQLESTNEKNFTTSKGNSLANAHGWSSTIIIQESSSNAPDSDKELKNEDYSSLLEKVGISPSKKVNYEDRLKEITKGQILKERESPTTPSDDSSSFTSYISKLYKIVREVGLNAQKYTCANCQVSIGLTFGEARLCHFTGEYYCSKCHLNEMNVIPSRIIFNWDHKKYPVCSKVSKYLTDICSRLLIDVKNVNPKLYTAVAEMKELRKIRVQLNMLRAYLYTCKESLLIELQKRLHPREYIYEFIDHYSINDLCQVPGGTLTSELSAIVSFGKNHVINCWLCSQRGFICEICKNVKIIYPFDLSTTYRCSKCFTIYHDTCLSSSKNCPKCIRIKQRLKSDCTSPSNED